MKGEKYEGKKMVPLFPGLHINDGDKGGPGAPPRKKMALFEEYNGASEGLRIGSGSRSMLPVPPINGCSSFVSQASSSNVASAKRKVRPILATMNECPHSGEWYHSHCSGGVSGSANYPSPSSSASLVMKAKCILVQPTRGFSSYGDCCIHSPGDENDLAVPSFLQSGKTLNHRNLQLHMNKEKVATFSSVSSGKLHSACLKLPNEKKSEDQTTEHHGNLGEEKCKLSQHKKNSLAGNKISELGTVALQPEWHKNSLGDETSRSNFPYTEPRLECKVLQKSKTVTDCMSTISEKVLRKGPASMMEDSSRSSPRVGDCNQRANINLIKKSSHDKDCVALTVGIAVKREEVSEIEGSIPGVNLTPDEVVRVTGQRLFLKARKTMVHQQKVFSLQMFELHRLIMVQRLIARSPKILHENNFHQNKPSIKFPPMNKLLYVSPLDTSPSVAKPKVNALKSIPCMDCGAEAVHGLLSLPTTSIEKGHVAQLLTPKPLPTQPSVPFDPKLAPWSLPSPPGNQWLIPVRSPSEGLIYKPYPGPCFPSVGFMAPVYGNCGPISLNSLGGTTDGVPAPNEHGGGGIFGAELSQSYFQPCPMPLTNASVSNPEVKQMIGVPVGELDKNSSTSSSNFFIPCQSSFKVSSQQSAAVSDSGGNLHTSKESDRPGSTATSPPKRLEGDALSLFPTTPSLLKDQRNDQKVQVIKVVPHNRNSAPASAARIFQSIQEERRKHE